MDADPDAKAVEIVASDQGGWPICADMMKNETVRNAIAIIGSHYPVQGAHAKPTPAECQALNTQHSKPLWTSEGWNLGQVNDYKGASNLALTINQNYVTEQQTAMIVWTVIYSWYSIFPFAHPDTRDPIGGMGHGLMSATEPWSGHYREEPTLYAVAHTTQFAKPKACHYLENSAVGTGGFLDASNGSSIVVFLCDPADATISTSTAGGKQWSVVIETASAKSADFATPTTFSFKNAPTTTSAVAATPLHVWRTCENASEWLQKQPDVSLGSDGSFSVQLKPQCIFTITTMLTAGAKAIVKHPIPAPAHMSLTYSDDFESYAVDTPVHYLTDEGGSFAAAAMPATAAVAAGAPVGSAGVLAQQVLEKPIHGNWWNDGEPWTVMGDSGPTWADYTVSVKAMVGGPAPAPAPGPGPLPATLLRQINPKSPDKDQCLNVMANVNPVFVYTCPVPTGHANEEWILGNGRLSSMGKCATTMPGGGVEVAKCNGSAAQEFSAAWPAIQQGGMCLGLGADSKKYPGHKLAAVSKCDATDPTQQWANSSHSGGAKSMMPAPQFTRVCARISTFKPDGTPPQGYCLIVDANHTWYLANGGTKGPVGRDIPSVLSHGQLPAAVSGGGGKVAWHMLSLEVVGSSITASVDGQKVAAVTDTKYQHGMVALGSGWHLAYFDSFSIAPK